MPFKSVGDEMSRFKKGDLHSGSHKGPKVTDAKQAIAIALSEKKKAASGQSALDGIKRATRK